MTHTAAEPTPAHTPAPHLPSQIEHLATDAHMHGKSARLIEIDPNYCDLIIRRAQDFTGRQATLEATGQTFNQVRAERTGATAMAEA